MSSPLAYVPLRNNLVLESMSPSSSSSTPIFMSLVNSTVMTEQGTSKIVRLSDRIVYSVLSKLFSIVVLTSIELDIKVPTSETKR
jgi:hypothetical protein